MTYLKCALAALAAGLFVSAAGSASAAPSPGTSAGDWVLVTTAADGKSKDSVDRSSMVRTGAVVRFKQRSDYVDDPEHLVSALVDVEINCEAQSMRPLAITITLDDGTQNSATAGGDFRAVAHNSIGEDVMKFVCAKPAG